ncbi:hypothetical protein CFE70_004517 [Pyrenophora teres f. teres 0-1]|uniref:Yeast cell wall synthesis Kre9/Knh1-like N-terminal domain-containing protein n=2 Tax=Pyrenophora teres f. teres TaxID=97479 RepID=E3RXF3_PYRTT|nr:hypothetical protein PTT_14065 [Pyrenophora teres f. teres 0-1]KAE8833466.1 hypothetical protein HRS9139_05285 [Pyrenophora teres f. teres]KAE8840765.1 hypothetical protein PTNB85_04164 [Pyrenophora teres f. teres]KAE8849096.1 hypothetical protein HRS9122_03112 [Pyrenophora teres f. teres]KAE8864261.1 hypothetical protein PTNB29_04225 [Pyrenophora teres f. teres]
MFTKAIVIFFAGLAAAQKHAPVGEPKGNPISAPLNEIVPACKPFTITWEPTTPNTVSVLLLKGPATNVVKFGPSLAEGISNSGKLSWTPSAELEETATAQGYGIQIIDDVTGQYQYSTQFGISKKECGAASSAPATTPAATPAPTPNAPAGNTPVPVTSTAATPMAPPMAPHATTICTTAGPYANATVVVPAGTGSMTLAPSASMPGNATTSHLPQVTVNAAAGVQAGLGFAGAVAAMAMMI